MASEINIILEVERLIKYAALKRFVDPGDAVVARNALFDLLKIEGAVYAGELSDESCKNISDILNNILRYCFIAGLLPDATVLQRDLMAARIMGIVTPSPREVYRRFKSAYLISPMEATDYLYCLLVDVDYIKKARADKNWYWDHEEDYGRLELTNNFQKKDLTAEELENRNKTQKPGYPQCELCKENVGFAGDLWRPSGRNLRVSRLSLRGEKFHMQFSAKQYYSERFFIVADKHEPMAITKKTFEIMLDFVDKYPHCFIGAEADLPGLGNKYQAHASYQGGCYVFPIEHAEAAAKYTHELFGGVHAELLSWPVSTLRLECDDTHRLSETSYFIYKFWRDYTDEALGIYAYKDGDKQIPQNSITAAARKNIRGNFEIDISFRNNQTSEERPYGDFRHRERLRHILPEEVGLINTMGLAYFPGSFDTEMLHIMGRLMSGKRYVMGEKAYLDRHCDWINHLIDKYGIIDNYETSRNVMAFEAARAFAKILEDCGVFKMTEEGVEAFKSFVEDMGFIEQKAEDRERFWDMDL